MLRRIRYSLLLLLVCLFGLSGIFGQSRKRLPQTRKTDTSKQSVRKAHGPTAKSARPNLAKEPTLYVVGYAHLDTEWRWEYPQTIQEYLTKTMRNNFMLFEKYPTYIFNFPGSNRYRMIKEYYPSDFEKLKQYVTAGRWFPAGSSVEEGDVNSPSAESIIRQILYGNNWFRKEFGIASDEYMLPDCFGFPASLPTILAHAGIKGFSTQKLSSAWQPAPHVGGPDSPQKTPVGIPFNVGIWEGPDGSTVIAALNPLSYGSQVNYDISKAPPPPPPAESNLSPQQNQARSRSLEDWTRRIKINGEGAGVFADYHYVGTGDVGGSPNENSVRLMHAITTRSKAVLPPAFSAGQQAARPTGPPVQVGDGPIKVVWSRADEMFQDILNCCETKRLPRYKGDLELINHSAGSLTSQAYQKRWNRKNELLADAAEKASVAAEWLGALTYPRERLNNAWNLVMGGQFHDILPGTATPKAFEFAWNDDVLAMNQFAGVMTSATNAIVSQLDTQTKGSAIVVYNPLSIAREDLVEATISFVGGTPKSVRVIGPDGKEVPAQLSNGKVVFLAKTPAVSFSVYDVQSFDATSSSQLKVSPTSLENARYRVAINSDGDVSSVFDKQTSRELLSSPIRLAILTDRPRQWPAWNMDFEDVQRPPRAFVSGSANVRVVEDGPARVSVAIVRETEDSKFVQTVSLSAGDAGNRVEFSNVIDWNTKQGNLKATFPLTATNGLATYNWDVGTIQRPNAAERQFEVGSHQWIDLTDRSGSFGATILTDCKYGSDKPDDKTIRLTLLRTPGTRGSYNDQATQDFGRHEIVFGLAGHSGDWHRDRTDWQGYRLNQPLIAFQSSSHPGTLSRTFSLLRLNNERVRVLALKKAELNDEVIVRLVETGGRAVDNVTVGFAGSVVAGREVNGQEQPLGPATISGGELVTSFRPYQLRTFALRLAPARTRVAPTQSQSVSLEYDLSVASRMGRPADGSFDWAPDNQNQSQGKSLPAELLPRAIDFAGIRFQLALPTKPNAVVSRGQTIALPSGKYNRVYLLAAAVGSDQKGVFRIGEKEVELNIQHWTGFIGQWDNRIWKATEEVIRQSVTAAAAGVPPRVRVNPYGEMIGLRPGFIKRADVAWFSSQRRDAAGNPEPYQYSYLFAYAIDVPSGARTIILPDNERIRILAVTVTDEPRRVTPAQPLYDTLER
ncbi:MAG TPA: glycoside hydrolase family 38 C-terminal domain-containing protein [Pyrinomonadaceae bacterium]